MSEQMIAENKAFWVVGALKSRLINHGGVIELTDAITDIIKGETEIFQALLKLESALKSPNLDEDSRIQIEQILKNSDIEVG